MKTLQDYINLGYEKSPYCHDEEIKSIRTVDLSSDDCRKMLTMNQEERFAIFSSRKEGELVVYKAGPYHVTPKDILDSIKVLKQNFDHDECASWSLVFSFTFAKKQVYSPLLDEMEVIFPECTNDYLFSSYDRIVTFIVGKIRNDINANIVPHFEDYELFIKETMKQSQLPKNERKYSDKVLSIIIQDLSFQINENPSCLASYEMRKFYHDNLLELAERNDYSSMRSLGYEYYEGTNDFELDSIKSTYYLEKCFNISHDPDLARTLGYVYYYGRTTDGIPQGDKAFQYFAIGHIAGHYFEATYKLADCYVKGYGTPVCHQAAYELVNGIYDDTLFNFLNDNDSKFADVALRLGSYYRDGIYVEKDINDSRYYYLQARCAIKKRLEHMEYVGDRGVAIGISNSLEEINKELGYCGRTIKNGGYLLDNYYQSFHNVNFKFSLDKNGYIHLEMSRNKNDKKELLHVIPSINLVERVKKVEYIIKCVSVGQDFVDIVNSYKIKEVHFCKDCFYVIFENEEVPGYAAIEEIIYIPKSFKNIEKQFTIVSVEFYEGSKLYDYLTDKDDIKIGDSIEMNSKGEKRTVIVRKIKKVYEDELPLPLTKMAKIS